MEYVPFGSKVLIPLQYLQNFATYSLAIQKQGNKLQSFARESVSAALQHSLAAASIPLSLERSRSPPRTVADLGASSSEGATQPPAELGSRSRDLGGAF